jgi:hypothetical protein
VEAVERLEYFVLGIAAKGTEKKDSENWPREALKRLERSAAMERLEQAHF